MTDRTATISVRTTADLSGTQELTAALSREALAAGDAAAALALIRMALEQIVTSPTLLQEVKRSVCAMASLDDGRAAQRGLQMLDSTIQRHKTDATDLVNQ